MARGITKIAALCGALIGARHSAAVAPAVDGSSEVCSAPGCGGGNDVASLLQVQTQEHANKVCGSVADDPYAPGFNGQCCSGLYKVKGTWGGNYCSYRCVTCSSEGKDAKRFCTKACGSCALGGDQIAPCCAGLDPVSNKNAPQTAICRRTQAQKPTPAPWNDRYEGLGPFDTERICAPANQDPFAGGFNGQCCSGLSKVAGKWYSDRCSFQCKTCTGEGGDVFRFCGSGCGGCVKGGSEYVPCCQGLTERNENGKMICRWGR